MVKRISLINNSTTKINVEYIIKILIFNNENIKNV